MYKKFLVFTLLLAIAFTAIAQTSNLDQSSSANLETALKNNDFDAVSTILNEADADIAPQFEATILQAAKNAVIKNKLDDAFKLAEIVLYYNFDNTEAQDLYTSIQQQKNKAVAAAEAKKKVEEQKKEEKFINDVKFIGIDDFSFGIAVTPAAMDFLTSDPVKKVYKTDGFSCRYGFGVDGFVAFNHPFIKVQLGVIWNLLPVNIAGESSHNLIDARFTLESPAFVKYLTITAGYRNS